MNYDVEEKNIQLHILGDQVAVEADEQLLRQALFNLVLNATQAVDPGGEIEILVHKRNGSGATLDIRDNGPGVPPEIKNRVFEPFFTTKPPGVGTGLGLHITYNILHIYL